MKTQKEILIWLRNNCGKHCTGALTSTDVTAFVASVTMTPLISWDRAPKELFLAYRSLVNAMQPNTRWLAYNAIAMELDWSHRALIWCCAELNECDNPAANVFGNLAAARRPRHNNCPSPPSFPPSFPLSHQASTFSFFTMDNDLSKYIQPLPTEIEQIVDEVRQDLGQGPAKRTPVEGIADMQARIVYHEKMLEKYRGQPPTNQLLQFIRESEAQIKLACERLAEYQLQARAIN